MNETIIGAIIGASATLIIGAIQNRISKDNAFSDVVTKQRINTINLMRCLVAEICALLQTDLKNDNEGKEKIIRLKKDILKLKMLLSIHYERDGNDSHFVLEQLLDNIIDNNYKIETNKVDSIIKISRYIFDYEWTRIKDEAGGVND